MQVPGCIDTALAPPLWIIIYIAHEQTARCITLTDQDLQRKEHSEGLLSVSYNM